MLGPRVIRRPACVGLAVAAVAVSSAAACSSAHETSAPDDGGSAGDPDASVTMPAADGGFLSCPPPSQGPTTHSGEISRDQLWKADGSPHVVTDDVVVSGATLTIEPCAVVQIKDRKAIIVGTHGSSGSGGALVAEGTSERPIRFEGAGAGERWKRIAVNAPATARLAHAVLTGAGADFYQEDHAAIGARGWGDRSAGPLLFVDHVKIERSFGAGVDLWMATFAPGSRDLTIERCGDGPWAYAPFPISLTPDALHSVPTGRYTGNRRDAIQVLPVPLMEDVTMWDRGVPYFVGYMRQEAEPRTREYMLQIAAEQPGQVATLTIEPGVVLEMNGGIEIQDGDGDGEARGALRAVGTAQKPIVFTSWRKTRAAGDWAGVVFRGATRPPTRLEHVRIEYAGGHGEAAYLTRTCSTTAAAEGALVFLGQVAPGLVTSSVFADSAGHALSQNFVGTYVDLKPTNTFLRIAGCAQTRPEAPGGCPDPRPACD
jgi:hypothetical protein